ncbi:ABC transporter substrate-binding protein [Thalassolituus maritimus]|uniref:ABC transporter substrate-binding protein n=1 Tax=Thalassolituus maritimus TaxID=484498 RepID=UPI0026F01140|nr:ABC transporter substrate-binding protein [Thalassolituus maritimus]|tara:strand:- start:3308 stop:4612 length:1305 start_codon:yes stop_codon:yes gene_type:complete
MNTKNNKFDMHGISRRNLMKVLAASSGAAALGLSPSRVFAAKTGKPFKIGFVTPASGPLAIFAEPDQFVLEQVKAATRDGIVIDGTHHPVEIIVKDSQSSSNRAADVAAELILNDEIDIMVAANTPETTNPVADQCEINGIPCVTNDTPWQPHFFGRGGDPKVGFEWTYHFFWGAEDIIGTSLALWEQIPTNKVIGTLWPNDSDGNAFGDPKMGFPPLLKEKGFELVDLGRYQSPSDDFSAYINEFKKQGVEIISGVIPPPDFGTFWSQAGQQGFNPMICTMAKATEFPAAIAPFGDRADGLTVEVWWSPTHPFVSGLTGQTSAELAAEYEAKTGRQWTMPLGFKHSLFEVAIDALKRSEGPGRLESIRDAIASTNYNSIVGPVNFQTGPVPNISKTPLVSGQWRKQGDRLELEIVENSQAPMIAKQAELRSLV